MEDVYCEICDAGPLEEGEYFCCDSCNRLLCDEHLGEEAFFDCYCFECEAAGEMANDIWDNYEEYS